MLRARDEQRFLRAEMSKERRLIDARNVGDLARRGAALSFAADYIAGRGKNSLACLLGRRGSTAFDRSARLDHGASLPIWTGAFIWYVPYVASAMARTCGMSIAACCCDR